jgi:hypothetical protein
MPSALKAYQRDGSPYTTARSSRLAETWPTPLGVISHCACAPSGHVHAHFMIGEKLRQDHPIVPSMLGSMALQQCLKAGWIEYRWMVFEKN